MKTVNTIKNFLYSKDYFINLFENNIHIYNFEELVNISDVLIELRFARFNVKVYGKNFVVKKMCKNEILVQGIVKKLEHEYYE